jgi:hypothetical protein
VPGRDPSSPSSGSDIWGRSLAWLGRSDVRAILAILVFAFGVRLICLERSGLIGTDSMRFLYAAAHVERGELRESIRDPFHPATAFLTAGVNLGQQWVLGEPRGFDEQRARRERAAHAVVLVTGILLVWLQIDLARRLFPRVPPGAVGLLAASQPYLVRSSADIMSDTPMLAFVMLALRAAVVSPARLYPAALCGASVGLAYLVRPEGLVALPTVLAFWLLRERPPLRRLAARVGLLALGLASVSLPYVVAISVMAGKPTLTLKKDLFRMMGIEAPARPDVAPEESGGARSPSDEHEARLAAGPAEPGSIALASALPSALGAVGLLAQVVAGWFDALTEVLTLGFLVGLWALWRHGGRSPGHTLYALCAAFMVAVLVMLMASQKDPDYLSRRHLFVLVVLALPVAAEGLLALGAALGAKYPRWGDRRGSMTVFGLALLGLTLHAVSAQREDQYAQLEAARWILSQYGPGEMVFSDREKVAYYADATGLALPPDVPSLLRETQGLSRAWVAFYYEGDDCCGPLAAGLDASDSGFELVQRLEEPSAEPSRTLLLYRSEQHPAGAP